MKFLVEMYRYLILGFVGLILIGLTFGIASGFSGGLADQPLGPIQIAGMLMVASLVILSVGGIAVIISIHDRHSELVQQIERIGDVLERLEFSKIEKSDE